MYPYPLFKIFGNEVYLYGIMIALGILACVAVLFIYTSKKKMYRGLQDFIFYIAIVAIAGGFLFAKLFQAFYVWVETGKFDFNSAGITVMGGLIGGAAIFLACYFGIGHFVFNKGKYKNVHIKQFNTLLLVAPICITIAHAFGRIGCLMSGCCHGAYLGKDYVVGGVWMCGADTGVWGYYVPAQLYESLFLFVLFGVLSVLYFKRYNFTHIVYLAGYGIWRFIIEFFRTDERGGVNAGLTPSQWTSVIFVAAAIVILIIFFVKKIPFRLKEEDYEFVPQETVGEFCSLEETSENETLEEIKEETKEENKEDKKDENITDNSSDESSDKK